MVTSDLNILDSKQWAGKTIGLLGGSFNPAHDAHLEISLSAINRLKLDAVWWLVSPQNPLKASDDMASLEKRVQSAKTIATDPRIIVTDIEQRLKTTYTADSLDRITALFPDTQFIWIMGADNLAQFPAWKDWKKIGQTVAFAIFDRPGYSNAISDSEAAAYFRDAEIPEEKAPMLRTLKAPAWTFIRDVQNPLSSTEIRRKNI